MRRRFQALAGLAVLSVVALLAPTTAGAVGDVATTTVLATGLTSYQGYGGDQTLRATVSAADGSSPAGVVVFSIEGIEQGRATLVPTSTGSEAVLLVDVAAGPSQMATAVYLGAAGFDGSQGTAEVVRPNALRGWAADATVQLGGVIASRDPSIPFMAARPANDPLTGRTTLTENRVPLSLTADVPGYGLTTVVFDFLGDISASPGTVGADGSYTSDLAMRAVVRRITVGGVTWAGSCTAPAVVSYVGTITGTVVAGHLSMTGTAAAPAARSGSDCDGRGDLVNALLAQPLTFGLEVDGGFTLPPAPGTPTTTTVTATPAPLDGRSSLVVTATVSAPGPTPNGLVRLAVSGGYSIDGVIASTGAGPQVRGTFYGPFPDGPVEVTATYLGTGAPYLASSDSVTVDRSPAPAGSPASGSVTFASGDAYPLAVGSVLQGGAFDPATGVIADASLLTPLGTASVNTGIIGTVQTVFRVSQVAPADGQVSPDGSVTLGPLSLTIETLAYRQGAPGPGVSLEPCTKTVTATLTGTADGDGLHLSAADVPLPPFPPGSCLGLSSTIDGVLGSSVDLAVEVAGDYRRDVEETSTSVTSWFSEVAQHNHGLFSAKVTSATAATGEVTFFDGTTELGSVPVASDGTALLAAPLDVVGPRTITARYSGDGSHVGSEGSTTVTVTPPPAGLSVGGSLQVGSVSIPIGEGSVLEPQGSASSGAGAVVAAVSSTGAQLSFQPVSVPMVLPGYGPATVEVRLVQNGRLTTAAVGSDGRFGGLAGAFALHVRKVTLAGGQSVTPLGCASVVLLVLDGQLQVVNATLGTQAGGSGAYRNSLCTGPGKAATNLLTGRTVTLAATISY